MAMTDVAIAVNDDAAPLVMAMMTGTPEAIAVMVDNTANDGPSKRNNQLDDDNE